MEWARDLLAESPDEIEARIEEALGYFRREGVTFASWADAVINNLRSRENREREREGHPPLPSRARARAIRREVERRRAESAAEEAEQAERARAQPERQAEDEANPVDERPYTEVHPSAINVIASFRDARDELPAIEERKLWMDSEGPAIEARVEADGGTFRDTAIRWWRQYLRGERTHLKAIERREREARFAEAVRKHPGIDPARHAEWYAEQRAKEESRERGNGRADEGERP